MLDRGSDWLSSRSLLTIRILVRETFRVFLRLGGLFVFLGAEISQRRVPASGVVKQFDVIKETGASFFDLLTYSPCTFAWLNL